MNCEVVVRKTRAADWIKGENPACAVGCRRNERAAVSSSCHA